MTRKASRKLLPLLSFFLFLPCGQECIAQTMIVEVSFKSAPSKAKSSFAPLKYNKEGVFNYEMDDRSPNVRDVFALFHGGIAPINNSSYPGKSFSDGCGNRISWRAAVATNARLESNNADWVDYNHCLTWKEMAGLIREDWMIENHGYYHNKTGVFNNGENTRKNVADGTGYIVEQLKKEGALFVPRVFVVPNADTGYVREARSLGYLAAVSQQPLDGFRINPLYVDQQLWIDTLGKGFLLFNRGMADQWNAEKLNYYTDVLNRFLADLNIQHQKLWRLGGHYFSNAQEFEEFNRLMNDLENKAADRLWITTLQEFCEYRETSSLAVKKESLAGNKLRITIDLSKLPKQNYFRDLSLLITADKAIEKVTVSGADRLSYNKETGLVNIFKKQNNKAVEKLK
jgi:hypothetical protein